jgi:hypothetical protein
MKIYLDKDGMLNLEGNFNEGMLITNKLDGLWMYDTLPERILPSFLDHTHVKFNIPIKYRKYGDVWQIYGIDFIDNLDVDHNIEVKKNNPLQIKLNRDIKIKDIRIKKVTYDSFILSRPLLKDETIVAKRRINTNYGDAYFSNEYVLNINSDKQICFLNVPKLIDELNVTEEDIVDLFIKNKLHKSSLKVDVFSDQRSLDETVGTMYKVYRNSNGSFSIYFYSKTPVYLKKVLWDGKNVKLIPADNVDANDITDIKLVETTKKAFSSSARVFITLKSVVQDNFIIINDSFFYNELNRRNKLSFKLFFSYKNSIVMNQFRTIKSEAYSINNDFKLIDISSNNFLGLELSSVKRSRVTKIAVLGSSHTRPMFTSSDFFNPDYKNYYKVVYTQFHSSIISLVGKPRIYENEYFKTRKPTVQQYIKTDFEKNFFNELKLAKPDYLIIDVYIDVQMGVIYFGDGSVISYNSYQAESKYVLEHLHESPVLSTVFNDPNYVKNYSKALKSFKTEILKIIPENRIIIHAFDMSEDYKNKNNEVKKYKQSNGSIAELNEIAVGVQSLLEETFPKAKVLDIRDSKYHGDEDNPLGNMPHHYESEYYKYLLSCLMKISYLNNPM